MENLLKLQKPLIALLATTAISAIADTSQCKDNFTSEGSFFTGTTYKTWAEIGGLTTAEAYKKVYVQTVKDGWKITNSDKDIGIISAAQEVSFGNGKSAPLNIVVERGAPGSTKISITFSLSGGLKSPESAVIESFCKLIGSAKR